MSISLSDENTGKLLPYYDCEIKIGGAPINESCRRLLLFILEKLPRLRGKLRTESVMAEFSIDELVDRIGILSTEIRASLRGEILTNLNALFGAYAEMTSAAGSMLRLNLFSSTEIRVDGNHFKIFLNKKSIHCLEGI